jgi:hypothetical protein
MAPLYFFVLPLVNAFNFSQTLIIPLLVGCAAITWLIVGLRMRSLTLIRLDLFIAIILLVSVFSSALNSNLLKWENLNHLIALFASVLLFYFGAERFSAKNSDKQILKALWWGFLFSTSFSVIEFSLVNFSSINIGQWIPRPAVVEYEPTFLDLLFVRARSTFEESGHFASYISTCMPFLIYYHWRLQPSFWGKFIFLISLSSSLAISFSVSAFIFIPTGVAIIFLFDLFGGRAGIKKVIFVTMIVVIAALFFVSYFDDIFYQFYIRKFQGPSFEDRNEKFLGTMNYMMQASLGHIIFGFGPGSYKNIGIEPAISVYLNALRDYGVLGLICWVLIFSYTFFSLIKIKSATRNYLLFSLIMVSLYFIAISNYFYPHFFLPFIFYKRLVTQKAIPCVSCS